MRSVDVDIMTGYGVSSTDGHEFDPLNQSVTTKPALNPVPPIVKDPGVIFITFDQNSGQWVTMDYSFIDLVALKETDFDSNPIRDVSGITIYYVTTTGTIVDVNNDTIQLDPVTMTQVNAGSTYQYQTTPTEFQPGFWGNTDPT